MSATRRRLIIFAALVAALAAAVLVERGDPVPPVRDKAATVRGMEAGARRDAGMGAMVELRLPARAAESGEILDPFVPRGNNTAGAPAATRKARAAAPPLPFVFLGRYDGGKDVQVFLGEGDEVHMVRAGDVIAGKYRVERIDSAVRMTYLPLNETQTLTIGEM